MVSVKSNRVLSAIEKMAKRIEGKLLDGSVTAEKCAELARKLDMSHEEFCLFQERKSLAQASGKLTYEEAQSIYCFLGESPSTFNGQDLATKSVLTQIFSELIR